MPDNKTHVTLQFYVFCDQLAQPVGVASLIISKPNEKVEHTYSLKVELGSSLSNEYFHKKQAVKDYEKEFGEMFNTKTQKDRNHLGFLKSELEKLQTKRSKETTAINKALSKSKEIWFYINDFAYQLPKGDEIHFIVQPSKIQQLKYNMSIDGDELDNISVNRSLSNIKMGYKVSISNPEKSVTTFPDKPFSELSSICFGYVDNKFNQNFKYKALHVDIMKFKDD